MTTKEVREALPKKGFFMEVDRKDIMFTLMDDNGKLTSITIGLSHGNQEIGQPLLSKMKNQLRLSKIEFQNLIKCTINEQQYKDILKEKKCI